MDQFLSAHAAHQDWGVALGRCVRSVSPVPAAANFGFLYVTDHFVSNLEAILVRLREATGVSHWAGSVGIGVCAPGQEYYGEPALAVMLCTFPPDSFRLFAAGAGDLMDRYRSLYEWAGRRRVPFGVVHANPNHGEVPELIVQLSELMDNGFLVGGLASSRAAYGMVADEVTTRALSGVLFSDAVAVSTRLTQGCSPLSGRHRITQGRDNYLFTLDDRPALDVLKEDVGEVVARNLPQMGGYIFAGLPIRGSDSGDYLVRNVVGIDPEQGVVAIGERIATGEEILFCRRDPNTAYEDLRRMVAAVKPSTPPKGAVYFSCLGRGPAQFGPDSRELKTVREILGDVPLVGFFCNGEISHNRLYSYTGVLTVFL